MQNLMNHLKKFLLKQINLESKKGDLLDPKSKNNEYMNIHNFKNTKDYVVDYKQVLQDFNEVMKPYNKETLENQKQF